MPLQVLQRFRTAVARLLLYYLSADITVAAVIVYLSQLERRRQMLMMAEE